MGNPFTSLLKCCNPDPEKAGKILLVLNALGMVFAAASNTFAASVDKNTSKEDKNFLVPAGAVTGAANIGIYYLMTTKIIDGLKKSAVKAVEKMSPKELSDNTLQYVQKTIAKKENGFLKTGLFKKSPEYIASMKNALIKNGEATQEAKDLFKTNMKAGAGVLGAFIGAVVGCAVLTPIIRDVSAYFVQKRMEKNNPSLKDKPYRPYFNPTHIGPKWQQNTHAKKQPLTMTSYMAFTSGNMKI